MVVQSSESYVTATAFFYTLVSILFKTPNEWSFIYLNRV